MIDTIINLWRIGKTILGGIVLLCVGIFILSQYNSKHDSCNLKITAVVTDYQSKEYEKTDLSDDDRKKIKETNYAPVYSYTYKGQEYNVSDNSYGESKPYAIGESVDIFIDSDNPSRIYTSGTKSLLYLSLILIAIGAGFIIYSVVMVIRTLKNRSSAEFY